MSEVEGLLRGAHFPQYVLWKRQSYVTELLIGPGSWDRVLTFFWHFTEQYKVSGVAPAHPVHLFVPRFWQPLKSNLPAKGLQHKFVPAVPEEAIIFSN